MKYKKLLKAGTLFMILFFNVLQAQNYRIYYQMKYKSDSLDKEFRKENMILLVRENKSKFFPYQQFVSDSLVIENAKQGRKSPQKLEYNFMIIKDNKEKKIYNFAFLFRDFYKASDNMPVFNWKIGNEIKKIGNYTCQKATLNHSSRDWEAWFTTDIALQEGPSIFNGLPGLIIYMKDTKDNYEFNFTALKKDEITDINFLADKPLEITKKQLEKVLKDYYNDPYRELKTGSFKATWTDATGKVSTPDYSKMTKEIQEEMKQNNNPVELAEAIKYP